MQVTIPKKAFNACFLPFLEDDSHRYLVLYGGAGSGKSVFAVQRFLVRMLAKPLCNLLVVRAVAATNRDSTFALFRQVISRWGLSALFACKESDLRITCTNGNSVIFKGLDDTEKLKSITFPKGELTDIWVEEETLQAACRKETASGARFILQTAFGYGERSAPDLGPITVQVEDGEGGEA